MSFSKSEAEKERRKSVLQDEIAKSVRFHISRYWEIKKAISLFREEQKRHVKDNIGGIQDSKLSDPTAREAIQNLTPLRFVQVPGAGIVKRPEAWIEAIESGLGACTEEVQEVAKQSFWGHRSWKYVTAFGEIDKKTFYKRRDTAVAAVAIAAAQRGLVSIGKEE